jgi:Glycosyltransferase family 87
MRESEEPAPGRLSLPHRLLAQVPWGPLAAFAAAAALVAFGIAGIGRHGARINGDMRFLYAAGKAWLSGRNPYLLKDMVLTTPPSLDLNFVQLGFTFAYPPQSSWLSMALAALPLRAASIAMVLLNLAATGTLAWFCVRLAALPSAGTSGKEPAPERTQLTRLLVWFVPVVVLGSPFTQHVLFMGQTSLLAVTLLSAGWYYTLTDRSPWLPGILLGASTLKPQLVVLPLLLLLLDRRFAVLAVGAATALVCAAPALIINGPLTSVHTWLGALDLYRQGDVQVAGFQHVFGVQSLFASAGIHLPNLFPLGIVVVFALWRSERFTSCERLGLALAASVLFVYSHDYDLAGLAPLFAALWIVTRGSNAQALIVLVALAGLFVPQRALRVSMAGPALHWRECILLALVLWRIVASRTRGPALEHPTVMEPG